MLNWFLRHVALQLWSASYFFAAAQQSYDRESLYQLTQFRQQHRFSDGRLCAAVFVQNFKAYSDCTDDPNPDGVSGREWCYVERQVAGPKIWGYCSPVIDYNLVRAKANEAFIAKANEVEKMVERLDATRNRLENILVRYNATCGIQHDGVRTRLTKIESLIGKADHCVNKIEDIATKVANMKGAISSIEEQIESQRAAALKAPENCISTPGYEDDPFPDGLRGAYYKNPFFRGPPIYRSDDNVNFQWFAKDPLPGIPYQSFSIRWDGYIQAPFSGDYTFITEADCGARVTLNGEPIIVDRMPTPTLKDMTGEPQEVPLFPPGDHDGVRKVESLPVALQAGEKNGIRIEMIHSNHLRWSDPDDASMRLKWKVAGMKEEIIPNTYLFQSNTKSPLKISGGAKTIRTKPNPTAEKLNFEVNVPARLYLVSPVGMASPFAPCEGSLHETDDVLSIYEAENRSSRARVAQHLSISRLEMKRPGNIGINILKPGIPFLAFLLPMKAGTSTCGGRSEVLSLPTSNVYESCQASSEKSAEFGCQYGLNGRAADQPFGCWKTTGGNGVGEFVIVRFNKPVQLTEMRFKPLDDPVTWPAEITLFFSETTTDEDSQKFTILHSSNMDDLRYQINPTITRYVRAEITKMYVNGEDSGGSIQFRGTQCKEEGVAPATALLPSPETIADIVNFPSIESTPVITIQDCKHSVMDLASAEPLESGKSLTVICPPQCLAQSTIIPRPFPTEATSFMLSAMKATPLLPTQNSSVNNALFASIDINDNKLTQFPELPRVFGSKVYALESSICAAAIHAGVCSLGANNPCGITIGIIAGKDTFSGEFQNGIQSQSHGPTELSVIFSSSVLKQISEEPIGVIYAISFRTVDAPMPPAGYNVDDGAPYGSKNNVLDIQYGWERIVAPVTCPTITSETMNPLNYGGIEFPPHGSSPTCDSGLMDCSPNSWSITLPYSGTYRLEAQVGNPCRPKEGTRKYFLQANGLSLIAGENLPKGKYFWVTQDINIPNKKLTLTADCTSSGVTDEEFCKTAITTIMNLKIIRIDGRSSVLK